MQAVDRTILQDQAMLAGTKIAAQDMVNAAAAALQDPAKPVVAKEKDNDTPAKKPEESEKSSP